MEVILAIIIIGTAFYWLGRETKWLTVRLPVGLLPKEDEALNAIISLTPMLVLIGFISGAIIAGFFGLKVLRHSVADYEKEMKRLWKLYGRKQPKIFKG